MRYALMWPALAGLTLALPRAEPQPQDLSEIVEIVQAAPAPVLVTAPLDVTTQVVSARHVVMEKRDGNCATQPAGSGPLTTPDDPADFLANPVYASLAENAPVPYGWTPAFINLQASLSASMYMGLHTLTAYDPYQCSDLCGAATGCVAFNLYIERDPTEAPNAQTCANPSSTVNFKCTLWGAPITSTQATNYGQYRDSFQVVIAGSNGYNINAPPPTPNGYNPPTELGGAINAPLDPATKANTYLGATYYPFSATQGFNPQQCADDCSAQGAYDLAHPNPDCSYSPCVFFNAYVLSLNGVPQGMACSKYDETWLAKYGTNTGYYSGSNHYEVSDSYSFSLTSPPQAPFVAPGCTPS